MNHKLTWCIRFASAIAFTGTLGFPIITANATAQGCTSIGDFKTAVTCILVRGDGLNVEYVRGSFQKISKVCNWRYEIAYTDNDGKNYRTHKSSLHESCDTTGKYERSYSVPYKAKSGRVCARLYQDGVYSNAACVSIVP